MSPDAASAATPPLLHDYAQAWLAGRDLADLTRGGYGGLLDSPS